MSLCGTVNGGKQYSNMNDGEAYTRRTAALIALNSLDRQHKKGGMNEEIYIHELKLHGISSPIKTINEMCNSGTVIRNEKGWYVPCKNWVAGNNIGSKQVETRCQMPNKTDFEPTKVGNRTFFPILLVQRGDCQFDQKVRKLFKIYD